MTRETNESSVTSREMLSEQERRLLNKDEDLLFSNGLDDLSVKLGVPKDQVVSKSQRLLYNNDFSFDVEGKDTYINQAILTVQSEGNDEQKLALVKLMIILYGAFKKFASADREYVERTIHYENLKTICAKYFSEITGIPYETATEYTSRGISDARAAVDPISKMPKGEGERIAKIQLFNIISDISDAINYRKKHL